MGVSLVLLDDFNRANGALGSNWAAGPFTVSTNAFTVVSNKADMQPNLVAQASWIGSVIGPDVEFTVESWGVQTADGDRWIFVRGDDTTQTALGFWEYTDGNYEFAEIIAGSYNALASGGLSATPGDVLSIKVIGKKATISKNGSSITSVTTVAVPHTTENRVGFTGGSGAGASAIQYDNARARSIGGFPVADRGSAQNKTAAATIAVDMAAAGSITVGNYLVMRVACDNAGSGGVTSLSNTVTDPRSNTWTMAQATYDPVAAAAGVTVGMAYCKVVNPYTNGDDITVNFSPNTTAKAVVIEEWSNIDGTTPVIVSSTSTTGASGTPSISRTPAAAENTVIAALATEGPSGDTYTADSDTASDAPWRDLTRLGNTGGTTTDNMTIAGAYKTVNDTTAQTWNPTITSRDWVMIAMVFQHTQVSATSLTLTPATVTATAVALTRTLGGVALTLTPAQATITAVALTRTVGAINLTLTAATITITAVALTCVVIDPFDLQVSVAGDTASLTWDPSPTPDVSSYSIFRRTPTTGAVFDPEVDTPVATGVLVEAYDDEALAAATYEWQVFGLVGAPAFSPLDIANLAIWLDATDAGTITATSGAVSQWDDKSGNGRDFTQGTGTNQPATGTHTIGGLNALRFDGTNDRLMDSSTPYILLGNPSAATVFYVLKNDADTGGHAVLDGWGAAGDDWEPWPGDGTIYHGFGSSTRKATGVNPNFTTARLVTITSASGAWSYRIDRSTVYTTGTNTVGWNNASEPYIGWDAPASGAFAAGQVGEIVIYAAALGTTDRDDVESYLAAKWGTA